MSVSSAACLAAIASDGRDTWTSPGLWGFAVAGSTARTASTWRLSVTTKTLAGAAAVSNIRSAVGRPMNAAVSRFG